MSRATNTLSSGWKWRLANAHGNAKAESLPSLKEWTAVSVFPSVVQMELLEKKIIPDPNIGENEREAQWAGEVDWEYACSFQTPATISDRDNVDLVFEGLDTFATVRLNGEQILKSDNMFIPARVSVRSVLRPAGEVNNLCITFESALRASSKLEKEHGARTSLMRDKRRMHIRKAQYHWGWDWGPIILTAGPYMPIYLEFWNSRFEHVHVTSRFAEDYSSATVSFGASLANTTPNNATSIEISILDSSGATAGLMTSVKLDGSSPTASGDVELLSPKLWWPNGQGGQHLYTAKLRLLDDNSNLLDEFNTRFGARTIEIVQRPLKEAPGTTFMFRVNGRDIFAQGGDWIPADMLLPTISRKRYFDWIEMAKECHLNMIRVWGGGIYETEDFFDACDEMGILVWNDYAFACGDYPVHDSFINNLAKEVEVQTIRLRNRASLALLCGGNEDFMFADELNKIEYDRSDTAPFDNKPFPQRKIYLDLIPKITARLCPNVPYWANSPFGGASANDRTVGDIHQWDVWHMSQLPYQNYKDIGGRFVSEFGMHGFPVLRTVKDFCRGAPESQLHPQSKVIDCHNKGHGAHTRIARYLAENFRFDMTSLRNFVYSSQLMQSEAYCYALQHWKRQFGGPGFEECAGAIIWQLNDVYPGTSWAFVDYFLRPKPAFYTIRRAFAPLSVGVNRTPGTRWIDEDKPRESEVPSFELWAHNTTATALECSLKLRTYDFESNTWTKLPEDICERAVKLRAGQNTELGILDAQPSWAENSLVILEATLVDSNTREQLARYVDWPEPYRYLYWPKDTEIIIRVDGLSDGSTGKCSWNNYVSVSSNQPLKGVWLEPIYDGQEKDDDREPRWEDNMFDLMPGQEITVGVNGLRGRKVSARFLGDWEVGNDL